MPEQALGNGASANVSRADKENAFHKCSAPAKRRNQSRIEPNQVNERSNQREVENCRAGASPACRLFWPASGSLALQTVVRRGAPALINERQRLVCKSV